MEQAHKNSQSIFSWKDFSQCCLADSKSKLFSAIANRDWVKWMLPFWDVLQSKIDEWAAKEFERCIANNNANMSLWRLKVVPHRNERTLKSFGNDPTDIRDSLEYWPNNKAPKPKGFYGFSLLLGFGASSPVIRPSTKLLHLIRWK